MQPVELYTFTYLIDGLSYGGQIPARSFEEAQKLVPFAVVDGRLIDEVPYEEEFTPMIWNGRVH
jgi:hypothetical protein